MSDDEDNRQMYRGIAAGFVTGLLFVGMIWLMYATR